MKRNGKIAQLPEDIRALINYYLYLKHSGKKILNWLNKLPEVKALFGGSSLNGQNLSEWRNGGYKEWYHKFTGDNRNTMRDPVFRRHYLSLLQSRVRDAVVTLQYDLVRYILDALNKQAQSEKKTIQDNPANN